MLAVCSEQLLGILSDVIHTHIVQISPQTVTWLIYCQCYVALWPTRMPTIALQVYNSDIFITKCLLSSANLYSKLCNNGADKP